MWISVNDALPNYLEEVLVAVFIHHDDGTVERVVEMSSRHDGTPYYESECYKIRNEQHRELTFEENKRLLRWNRPQYRYYNAPYDVKFWVRKPTFPEFETMSYYDPDADVYFCDNCESHLNKENTFNFCPKCASRIKNVGVLG